MENNIFYINQGKHSLKDNTPIVEENVIGKIVDLEVSETVTGLIRLKFELISGKHKGRIIYDKVNCVPNTTLAWKYLALREAIGKPYSTDEDSIIDAYRLFLRQDAYLNLSTYSYTDKQGQEHLGQKISYSKKLVTMKDLEEIKKEEDDDPSCHVFDFDNKVENTEA